MKKVLILIALILVAVTGILLSRPDTEQRTSSGCIDNRKQMISDLGGSEQAASNGTSSTLQGCKGE